LLPLLFLLATATIVLHLLEDFHVIDTESQDDWIHHPPLRYIFTERTAGGAQILIKHSSMVASRFPKEKPAGALRLFLGGGSFALGTPVVEQGVDKPICGGIAEWMRDDLHLRYPHETIEILNVAAGGASSFRVVETIRDILPFSPDIVFVIAGNNDGFSSVLDINKFLHHWVTYRAFKRSLLADPTLEDRLAAEIGHELNAEVIGSFIDNLQRIVDLCAANHVKVMLATMPINLRPTLAVLSPQWLEQGMNDEEFRAGERLFGAGDYQAAIEHYTASEAMVPASYRLAECHERLGDFAQAEYFYRFNHRLSQGIRASYEANERIRQLAAAHDHVYLVDLEKAAREVSPHGLPGLNLYVDICHMRHEGYYLMAQEALRVMEHERLIPASFGRPGPKPTMEEIIAHYNWTFDYEYDLATERQP